MVCCVLKMQNYTSFRAILSLISCTFSCLLVILLDATHQIPPLTSQDPAPGGPYFRKLSGGYVSHDRIPPATNIDCSGAVAARQTWTFTATGAGLAPGSIRGVLKSVGQPGMCLSVGAAWDGESSRWASRGCASLWGQRGSVSAWIW